MSEPTGSEPATPKSVTATAVAPRRKARPRCAPRRRSPSDERAPHRAAMVAIKPLVGYLDSDGRPRELLALPGSGGSVLVLDRDATTLGDRRLVAHLAPDEPPENASLVCRLYLEDAAGRWCRRVEPGDLELTPFVSRKSRAHPNSTAREARIQVGGVSYRLGADQQSRTTAQLRWSRRPACGHRHEWKHARLREVVGAFESYEPIRTLTEQALADYSEEPTVLSARLRDEFERLCASPIVLNRGLREAVLEALERGTTMSEISLRCGIVKHDRRGKPSGETSWLARRVGLMPEGGARATTPWIHSDVLAAIARRGLGLSPREVELQ